MLHAEVSGSGLPLVLAHGFTQTGRSWGTFGDLVSPGRTMVRVDLPGHGGSSAVRADLTAGGRLLAAAGREAGSDGAFDLLGYSLGARFALHAAFERPSAVRRLVLVGGTAGIDDPDARAARRSRDDAMADDLERSGDVDGFLARWLAAPMFSGLPASAAGLEERRHNTAAGLASSLRLAGTGTQEPLWDRLGELTMPVLVLVGADDLRFTIAGRRLADGAPQAVLSLVPGAGHAAHLAQPRLTARMVAHFLA